jgi:hypothetical protein
MFVAKYVSRKCVAIVADHTTRGPSLGRLSTATAREPRPVSYLSHMTIRTHNALLIDIYESDDLDRHSES